MDAKHGWLLGALLMAGAGTGDAEAQARAPQVTDADYARAARLVPQNAAALIDHALSPIAQGWLDAGRFWYRDHDADGDRFLVFDVASGKASPAFDHAALAKALGTAGKGGPAKVEKLPVTGLELLEDGSLAVATPGGRFQCKGDACTARPQPETGNEPGAVSPDGRREAFVRDDNLWLRDLASGRETPLTFDGKPDHGYATDNAGWQHSDRAIVRWSPDGTRIASFRQDQRKLGTMTLVGTNPGAPKVQQWKYPFAGDEHVAMIERVVIDLSTAEPTLVKLKTPPEFHRSTCSDDIACDGGWDDVQWAKDGKTLAFVSTDRGHKSATLRVADARTGAVREVYAETVATQYQSAPAMGVVNWRYLPESGEFIWFSQESGWGHLSLHDLATGKRKRQITSGAWNVDEIRRVDEASRTLWFVGNGREPGNPYHQHFYRVPLDGGDVTHLTPEAAHHDIALSPDGAWFVDTASTLGTPGVARLRSAQDGAARADIARADVSRLKAAGWRPLEEITVKARDGVTDLYGMLARPANFDPARRYPVVVYIYPGPQGGSLGSQFGFRPVYGDSALAELGFVVIAIEGMGNPLRSKAFQDLSYANMADNTLPDQLAAIRQLGAKYPWFDTSRVGIWGHSGGGNATAAAMFRHPEVFKAGIAESGNHDNLLYEDDWGERYHGLLAKNPDGTTNYTGQDNAPLAKHLKGKLFLIHGMMDDNVPPQSTLLVVDALVKANKDFDLLLLPHARHGFGADSLYVTRRRWDFFVKHLLGAEPPAQFELKAAP